MKRHRILTHIVNMHHNMSDDYILNQLGSLYHDCAKYNTSLVRYHGMRMGRQDYCIVDSRGFRFWVWDFPAWSVQVSNKRGVNFFVQPELIPDEVEDAFKEYLAQIS